MKTKLKSTRKYRAGIKLSYLTILKFTQAHPNKVLCLCVCGKEKEFYLSNIIPKKSIRFTKSCGCKRSELVSKKNTKHGMSKTKFHRHWMSMFERTENENYINHSSYVGIKVCKRWEKFENFRDDMLTTYELHEEKHGGRETTLERIDVFKGYNPKNCTWATQREQSLNKKNTLRVEYMNKILPLKMLCRELGKDYYSIYHRIKNGKTLEQALYTPLWTRTKNS